jgi:CheY-like chemotaxis protein
MNIPVVIVDNAETDRYIARRRFSRAEGFGNCVEFPSGADFIRDFPALRKEATERGTPTVVLMDISMPGRNGFQVISEFLARHSAEDTSDVIFVMYTSSNAMVDREQAASQHAVRGYVHKPLMEQDVLHIRELAG